VPAIVKKRVVQESIKVAVKVGEGIMVHAKGRPAQKVAVAAAAGIAMVAAGMGYCAFAMGRKLIRNSAPPGPKA
jgi:hypothetical protein